MALELWVKDADLAPRQRPNAKHPSSKVLAWGSCWPGAWWLAAGRGAQATNALDPVVKSKMLRQQVLDVREVAAVFAFPDSAMYPL
jgi:hypothetical protein